MKKLFLDDIREPMDCVPYMYRRIGASNILYQDRDWIIVRNYNEFIHAIEEYAGQLSHISYDHDLADGHYTGEMYKSTDAYYESIKDVKEKTGYHCAQYMKEYYDTNKIDYPVMFVHSMNPVGMQAIIDLFK